MRRRTVPRHSSSPIRIHYGPAALERLGAELDRLACRRALIVTGRSLSADARTLARIDAGAAGRIAGVFDGVRPNSPLETVRRLSEEITAVGADALVALGGGSAMVTARAANVLAAEGSDIAELATGYAADGSVRSPRLSRPKLPMLAIPTTPTIGTTTAGAAVIEPGRAGRFELFDPKTRAAVVIVDPDLVAASPIGIVRASAFNTIAMATEGIVSSPATYFAIGVLAHALATASALLPRVLGEDPGGRADRLALVLAAVECGMGMANAGGGMCAALSHTIGHRFGVPNGELDAVLLPHVLDAVAASASPDARAALASALGGVSLRELFAGLGAAAGLRDLRVPREALDDLAVEAMGDYAVRTGPSTVTAADLREVLHVAW